MTAELALPEPSEDEPILQELRESDDLGSVIPSWLVGDHKVKSALLEIQARVTVISEANRLDEQIVNEVLYSLDRLVDSVDPNL